MLFLSQNLNAALASGLFLGYLVFASATGAKAASPADDGLAEAKRRFAAGSDAYRAGAFEDALQAFRAGYELSQRPAFLMNIGHCLRQLRRYEEAAPVYRQFIATEPDAALRAKAEAWLAQMETQAAAARRERAVVATANAPAIRTSGLAAPAGGAGVGARNDDGTDDAPPVPEPAPHLLLHEQTRASPMPEPGDVEERNFTPWIVGGAVVAAAVAATLIALILTGGSQADRQGSLATFGQP